MICPAGRQVQLALLSVSWYPKSVRQEMYVALTRHIERVRLKAALLKRTVVSLPFPHSFLNIDQ